MKIFLSNKNRVGPLHSELRKIKLHSKNEWENSSEQSEWSEKKTPECENSDEWKNSGVWKLRWVKKLLSKKKFFLMKIFYLSLLFSDEARLSLPHVCWWFVKCLLVVKTFLVPTAFFMLFNIFFLVSRLLFLCLMIDLQHAA